MKSEKWKGISGYEKFYKVSNRGRVKSIRSDRILKPSCNGIGYDQVCLSVSGIAKRKYVHRLVAEAFIDMPSGKVEVNHVDGNKKNNQASNLQWTTHRKNMKHASENGLLPLGEDRPISKLTADQVLEIRKKYAKGNTSHKKLGDKYGVDQKSIFQVVNRISWKHI